MAQFRLNILASHLSAISKISVGSIRRRMSSDDSHFKKILSLSQGGSVTLHRNQELKVDVIQLEHAEKKNALSGEMILQFGVIIEKLENGPKDDTRAILVTGAGDSFCAGADLSLVEANIKNPIFCDQLSEYLQKLLNRFGNLPVPSIALIDGPAFGGGAEFAVACDMRLTTPSGQLSFVHGRMGLSPGFGGGRRLVQLVGPARALDILITGRSLQGKELLDWGLASGRVIGEEEAFTWISENLRAEISTQKALKSVINAATTKTYEESIAFERKIFQSQWGGKDHLKALNRYRGKRD